MSFLSRAFGGRESRTLTKLDSIPSWAEASSGHHHGGGSPMTLGAFYACVTLLADTIASLSIKAYREKNGAQVVIKPQPALFLDSPYPGLTWFDWLWMLMESLAITGNGFGYVTSWSKDGRPLAIMPVHPDCISVTTPHDDPESDWLNPTYHINGQKVPSTNIIHIKRYPIAGSALGMSPIQKAAAAVGLGLAAERFGLKYFQDSATPSGILSTEAELTPEQQKRAMKSWIQSHQGHRYPAMLGGGLQWQSISITPNESQFLETRGFQRSEIAMWFRIPPHMIGDTEKSTSWGTGIEEQAIGFVTYTLRPWLTCIEQAMTKYLSRGQFAVFNIDGLLRGDVKTRWEAYQIGRQSGVYSVNDICALENKPPIGPEGDIRLQPMNFVPLGTPVEDYLGKNDSPPSGEGDKPPADGEEGKK